jgi:flagellar assembly protein FliH
MSLSNIIRNSHTAQLEIRPFLLLEANDEALYQSTWDAVPSAILARDDPASLVHTFSLSEPSCSQVDEGKAPVAAADSVLPAPRQDEGSAAAPTDSATAALPLPAHPDPAVVLQQAHVEAERCVAAAHAQAAILRTQGYEEGLRRGEEAGKCASVEQYTSVLASFLQATQEVMRLREDILRMAEEDIVTLAFHLARKIIRHEVRYPRDILAATLRHALEYVVDQEQLIVRVNPEDLQLAGTLKQDLQLTIGGLRGLTFEGDATIGRGGCVVTSAFGEIDARLEAQLKELERRFRAPGLPVPKESDV